MTIEQSDLPFGKTLRERFEVFHAQNPRVYELFDRFAMDAVRAGRKRIGAKMLWERMRWYTSVETKDPEGWKLNNDWHAFYARLWLACHPEHENFFELRRQKEI